MIISVLATWYCDIKRPLKTIEYQFVYQIISCYSIMSICLFSITPIHRFISAKWVSVRLHRNLTWLHQCHRDIARFVKVKWSSLFLFHSEPLKKVFMQCWWLSIREMNTKYSNISFSHSLKYTEFPICFLLGWVETASKQHIFITFFFSEVKTSPKYYVTVMFWFSELKTTPKYDVNATL